MKITILGSGTSIGVPVPCCTCAVCQSTDLRDNRLRASILVQSGDDEILIDCGPDFRQQMLRAHITHLSALLLTHVHYDHASGIDDLRPYAHSGTPFAVYAEENVTRILESKYDYIFVNRYPGVPQIALHTISPNASFTVGHTVVTPIRLYHGKLPIVGYRIGKLAYLTDCTLIPDSEWEKLQGVDTLIIDALRYEPHPTHMNVEEALEAASRIHPRITYFTHISDKLGLHAVVEQQLPQGVHLAYDGLMIEV